MTITKTISAHLHDYQCHQFFSRQRLLYLLELLLYLALDFHPSVCYQIYVYDLPYLLE